MIKTFCFILDLGTGFLKAALLMCLWNWTVTPLGAPAIAYWHAYLLGSLFSYVVYTSTWRYKDAKDDPSDEDRITWSITKPIALGLGFLIMWVIYLLTGPY